MVGDGKSAKDDMETKQGGQGDNSPADTRHLPVALASQVDPRSLDLMVGSNYGNFLSVNDAREGKTSMIQGTMETEFEGETVYCNNIKFYLNQTILNKITNFFTKLIEH